MWQTKIARLLITIVIGLVSILVGRLLIATIEKYGQRKRIKLQRRKMLESFVSFFLFVIFILSILYIWENKAQSLWVIVTSIAGIVGIAFFAQWSFLSNIFAGFLLFYTVPFKIDDCISLVNEGQPFRGTVVNMTLFFVTIQTDDKDIVTIPNNVVLQKIIRVHKRSS